MQGPSSLQRKDHQLFFLCPCGKGPIELKALGCCRRCYDRRYHSLRFFGGMRERVLERDRFRCRACGTRRRLLVHHRTRSNAPKVLVTLCIRCHSRIHRSLGVRHWLSGLLLKLWCELHQHEPMQAQFAFTLTAKNERSKRSFGQRIEVLASFSLRNLSRELRVARGICAVPVTWEAGGGKLL